MERAGANMVTRAAPESDRCELEAAEALAGLRQCSDNSKRQPPTHSQDKRTASQQINDFATSSRITSENIVEFSPSGSSGKKIPQSKSQTKKRLTLTEEEKEERKVRRLLANREAARQTIRRRQAMFLELNNNLAHVSEENENLKKAKELAVKEYDSLKYRNEFLKSQLANTKKDQSRSCMQEELMAGEKYCSHPRPNHRSIVPCFWPHPIFPPLDVPKSLCASHSPKVPMFLYPMHCLLPCYSFYGAAEDLEENGRHCSMCSKTRLREDKRQDARVDETSNSKKSMTVGSENTSHMIRQVNKEMEDTFAATEARRRRKELMRLKGASLRHHDG